MPVVDLDTACNCILHFRTCEGQRIVVLPVGLRHRRVHNQMLLAVSCHRIDFQVYARLVIHIVVERVDARKFECTHGHRLMESDFHPVRTISGRREINATALASHQLFPRESVIAPDALEFKRSSCITLRSREGKDGDIPVVTPVFRCPFRHRKIHIHLSSRDIHTTAHDGSHRILRLYPWTSGHGPARTVLDGEVQS